MEEESGIRESDPRPRLGKPVHYHCANAALFLMILPTAFVLQQQDMILHIMEFMPWWKMVYSFNMAIMRIKGVVKDYAWGNKDFIPALLGYSATERPQAEYWMGTHPSGESTADGTALSEKIGRRLPFLFKVLAIDSPLSLQCHPTKEQAMEGWKREEEIRARGEGHNYQDDNEKAEVLAALTPVTALCGFKDFDSAVESLKKYIPASFSLYLKDKENMKDLFLSLFALSPEEKCLVLEELENNISSSPLPKTEGDYFTAEGVVSTVLGKYKGDIGCVFPLMMNVMHVAPGEALYLQPDTLHAYVKGNGMELMTASDNVLRGGLTPKRIDLKELSSLLYFGNTVPGLVGKKTEKGRTVFLTPSPDFLLSHMGKGKYEVSGDVDAIVMVEEGRAVLEEGDDFLILGRGETAFVEKGSKARILVDGSVYMASEKY